MARGLCLTVVDTAFWLREDGWQLSAELFAFGMSTEGIAMVSRALFGVDLGPSTASWFNEVLQERYEEWLEKPIEEELAYLYLDAVRIKVCRGRQRCTEGALVAMGITRRGERRMLVFVWGPWERTETWTTLLRLLTSRGLDPNSVDLVTVDGNPGLLRALRDEWPKVLIQRCWQHKTRNILGATSHRNVKELMRDLRQVKGRGGSAVPEVDGGCPSPGRRGRGSVEGTRRRIGH